MRQSFVQTWKRRVDKKYRVIYKRGPSTVAMFFAGIALASWAALVTASGFPLAQYLYYRVRPATSEALSRLLSETAKAGEVAVPAVIPEEPRLPERDVSLPEGHYLSIPKIGVDTVVWEAATAEYESALRRGVWRVGEFSTPEDVGQGRPVILSAHRFGYLEWTNEYRKKNSFFNLPKLQPGDELEVVWDQRRYRYRVAGVEEGEEIGSYEYDLILYTCKFLVSPIRIFVYADLVD